MKKGWYGEISSMILGRYGFVVDMVPPVVYIAWLSCHLRLLVHLIFLLLHLIFLLLCLIFLLLVPVFCYGFVVDKPDDPFPGGGCGGFREVV